METINGIKIDWKKERDYYFSSLIEKPTTKEEYLDELINAHWKYVEGILEAHQTDFNIINAIKYHYCSSFRHGYKHAKEMYDKSN